MTTQQAICFVERHGIVLESARGPVPNLAVAIAGEPLAGHWWSHPKAHSIHATTRAVRESPDVLVCRLVDGKVTMIHRRLWPALVRLQDRLPKERLAAVREVHTSRGHHEVHEIPFPEWIPREVFKKSRTISVGDAEKLLGEILGRVT